MYRKRHDKDEEQGLGKHPEFGWGHEWLAFRVKEEALCHRAGERKGPSYGSLYTI